MTINDSTSTLVEIRAVLGRAYADDPLTRWMFPDDATRVAACAAWYGLFVEAYLASGRVTWLDDERAVCLWRGSDDPPLAWPKAPPTVAGLLDALAGVEHAAQVADALHTVPSIASPRTHVYVNFLAVDPDAQGSGAGRRALQPVLDHAAERGIDVRLETTNPRNHSFYRRLGFAVVARLALGDGPELVAMEFSPAVRQPAR